MLNWRSVVATALVFLGCSDGPSAADLGKPAFEGIVVSVFESARGREFVIDADTTDGDAPESLATIIVRGAGATRTMLQWSDGGLATSTEIAVGLRATVWAEAVMESLPPQAYAEWVILGLR